MGHSLVPSHFCSAFLYSEVKSSLPGLVGNTGKEDTHKPLEEWQTVGERAPAPFVAAQSIAVTGA